MQLTYYLRTIILALLSCGLILLMSDGRYTTLSKVASADSVSENSSTVSVLNTESVWTTMARDFTLGHKEQNAQVRKEIHKLLLEKEKLYEILNAAAPYIYFIHQQTRARGLPAELALIPFIESEFNPNDRSKKGATGLWQLMKGTAHILGVKVKSGYDGRRNVIASTKAALTYFEDLGKNFKGNWYLAIAAYNSGQYKVESAVRRAGSHNFWDLKKLPRETKEYVPKLLAAVEVIQNPEKYGVQLPQVNNEPYFTQLLIKKTVKPDQVAKSAGVDMITLQKLNPDYNHGVPDKDVYSLLLPVDNASEVHSKFRAP